MQNPSEENAESLHAAYDPLCRYRSQRWGRHFYLRSYQDDLCQIGHLGLQEELVLVKNGKRYDTLFQHDQAAQGRQTARISRKAKYWMYRSDKQWEDYDRPEQADSLWLVADNLAALGVWLLRLKPNLFEVFIRVLESRFQEKKKWTGSSRIVRMLLYNCLSQKKKAISQQYLSFYPWLRKMPVELTGA